MPEIKVRINSIEKPELKTKVAETKDDDGFVDRQLVTTIKFEAKIHPASVARILNLQRQGAPLLAIISSMQATLDLNIQEEPAQAFMPAEKEAQL